MTEKRIQSETILTRVHPGEKARYILAAKKDGIETLSGWFKWLARNRCKTLRIPETIADEPAQKAKAAKKGTK